MRRLLPLAFAALVLCAEPAFAQSAAEMDDQIDRVLGDHAAFHDALVALQSAVASEDAEAVAEYIPFDTPINVDGDEVTYSSPDEFVAAYADIVTPEVVDAIESQTYETLFVNQQGVMIGNGEVWLGGICRDEACSSFDVKITAIQSVVN
jgi:hypothetical protein